MGLVQEIAGTKSLESDALEVTYSLGHLQNIVETHMKMLHELQKDWKPYVTMKESQR